MKRFLKVCIAVIVGTGFVFMLGYFASTLIDFPTPEEAEARTSGTNFHSRVRASRTHVRSSGGSGSGLDRSAYVTDAYRPRFGNSIFWTFHGYTPPSDMMMDD